jgi:hypothetical protein
MAALQRDGVRMATAVALIVGRLHRRGVGHVAAVILFGDGMNMSSTTRCRLLPCDSKGRVTVSSWKRSLR